MKRCKHRRKRTERLVLVQVLHRVCVDCEAVLMTFTEEDRRTTPQDDWPMWVKAYIGVLSSPPKSPTTHSASSWLL